MDKYHEDTPPSQLKSVVMGGKKHGHKAANEALKTFDRMVQLGIGPYTGKNAEMGRRIYDILIERTALFLQEFNIAPTILFIDAKSADYLYAFTFGTMARVHKRDPETGAVDSQYEAINGMKIVRTHSDGRQASINFGIEKP